MIVEVKIRDVLGKEYRGQGEVERGHPIVTGLGSVPALMAEHMEEVYAPLETVCITLKDEGGANIMVMIKYPAQVVEIEGGLITP